SWSSAQFLTPRSWPRSSPTTLRPAFVSSAAMIPPTQPTPTMPTSAFLLATSHPSRRLVRGRVGRLLRAGRRRAHRRSDRCRAGLERQRLLLVRIRLAAEDVLLVQVAPAHRVTGEADPLPADHVAVAAVGGVGEHPLEHVLAEHREEVGARERGRAADLDRRLAGLQV